MEVRTKNVNFISKRKWKSQFLKLNNSLSAIIIPQMTKNVNYQDKIANINIHFMVV